MGRSLEWMDKALCAQIGGDLWFPELGGEGVHAKRTCDSCPVQRQCADYAQALEGGVAHPYRHGTWGGANPRQRARQARAAGAPTRTANREYDDEIGRLDRQGLSARQISEQLGCTPRTVARARERQQQQAV